MPGVMNVGDPDAVACDRAGSVVAVPGMAAAARAVKRSHGEVTPCESTMDSILRAGYRLGMPVEVSRCWTL
jgi:hypothetical protein